MDQPRARTGSRTVLVVDDDDGLRRSVRRTLELHGYRVTEAATAQDARRLSGEDPPDLVIMDVVLPGMEGVEAANLMRAARADLPVLYVSGYTSQETLRMGRAEGAAFLRKPFGVGELLDAVRAILP